METRAVRNLDRTSNEFQRSKTSENMHTYAISTESQSNLNGFRILGIQKNDVKNSDWYKEFNLFNLCARMSEDKIKYNAETRQLHSTEDIKLVADTSIHSKFENILDHAIKFENPVSAFEALLYGFMPRPNELDPWAKASPKAGLAVFI